MYAPNTLKFSAGDMLPHWLRLIVEISHILFHFELSVTI